MRDRDTIIQEQRRALEEDAAQYSQAMDVFENPARVKEFLNGLRSRLLPLMSYNPDQQPAHSAVAVVSSMQERLSGVFQDLQFIEDYEDRVAAYKALVGSHTDDDELEATE